MKQKAKREPPLAIRMPFDDAIRGALKVKPPPEGWPAYEAKLKRARKRRATKRK